MQNWNIFSKFLAQCYPHTRNWQKIVSKDVGKIGNSSPTRVKTLLIWSWFFVVSNVVVHLICRQIRRPRGTSLSLAISATFKLRAWLTRWHNWHMCAMSGCDHFYLCHSAECIWDVHFLCFNDLQWKEDVTTDKHLDCNWSLFTDIRHDRQPPDYVSIMHEIMKLWQ